MKLDLYFVFTDEVDDGYSLNMVKCLNSKTNIKLVSHC